MPDQHLQMTPGSVSPERRLQKDKLLEKSEILYGRMAFIRKDQLLTNKAVPLSFPPVTPEF